MDLHEIQEQLRAQQLDGWLFFDHHQRDPIAYRVLSLDSKLHVTRRWYYWIPAQGEPLKLVHRIESRMLDALPGERKLYSGWQEQRQLLECILKAAGRIAMQFSPDCMIPYVSLVDGGTVDLIRGLGKEVVTSGPLVQYFEARWMAAQLESHYFAGRLVDAIRQEAFEEVSSRTRANGSVQEVEIAEFILARFAEQGMVTDASPIVAANANASNPHYAPSRENSTAIRRGDLVLIDMWAKLDHPGAVYYDITWTGYCGEQPPSEMENVFTVVRDARDRAVDFVREAIAEKRTIGGWEVDDVTRGHIQEQGFGEYFTHRTGHSIGEDVHGNGANLDNLETHDERPIIARTCFSVEPGIYLEKFGIRSEINCYVSEKDAGPTGEVQQQLLRL